jgi:hypothetical protein
MKLRKENKKLKNTVTGLVEENATLKEELRVLKPGTPV